MSSISGYHMRLEGIRFRGRLGVSDSERDLPQDFLVTVAVTLPAALLPHADAMRDVFDYDRISTLVVEEGTGQQFRLLETLAQRLIERIFADTPATRVSIAITKSRPPTRSSVDAVCVEVVGER